MKLGDFFVEIGIQTDKKSVKAIDEQIKALKELEEQINIEIKKEKELAEAQTEEQKARIKKKYEIKEEVKLLQKQQAQQKASIANFRGMIKGIVGVAVATGTMVFAFDRMITRLAMANQKLVNFQQQTGISFRTLNKYASANVSANPLTSIESTAGSLQNLAQNLWDIQLGRGDVSAFQELSYFSGMNVTPYGKSIEEVIESVRSALTKIPNDVQATNLIQRMGFNADDLQMLRMTREEFEKTQNLFLDATQRKQLEKTGKQLNIIHLQLKKIKDIILVSFSKELETLLTALNYDIEHFGDAFNRLFPNFKEFVNYFEKINFVLDIFSKSIFYIVDDLIHYLTGGNSVIGLLIAAFEDLPIVQTIKNIGESVNKYFQGSGWSNLSNLLALGGFNPGLVTANALENMSKSVTQNVIKTINDRRTNNITINTENSNVVQSAIETATTSNYNR